MSTHPTQVETRRILVVATHESRRAYDLDDLAGETKSERRLRLGFLGGPATLELFEEAQADQARDRGEGYRFESSHSASRSGPPGRLVPWAETTPGA